jgi:hypothetical protein
MYAVATFRMRLAIDLGPLAALPALALALALLAWTATFAGLVHHFARLLRRAARGSPERPDHARPPQP